MPSLIDIRRRVRAIKSTQQITKAMKMVSSSKLRRAQERIVRSRPYAQADAARVQQPGDARRCRRAPAAARTTRRPARTLLVVITADRGLCGSFNTNVIKAAAQYITEHPADPGREVALALVGRKGRDFFMRRGFDVRYEEVGLFQNVKWAHAQAIAQHRHQGIPRARRELGVSRLQRVPVDDRRSAWSIERLLPIAKLPPSVGRRAALGRLGIDYLFEPTPAELLEHAPAVPRRGAGQSRAARIVGGRTRGAHDGHGRATATRRRWSTG